MIAKQHRIMAFSLALLVLISTTGFNMNMMLCNCTGKQYLAVLASQLNLSCCKAKLAEAAKSCCASTDKKKCNHSKNENDLTILADKDCCSSIFKWQKANINLDLIQQLELPTSNFKTLPTYWSTITYQTITPVLPVTIALTGSPNKAPPRFGCSLQNWFQTYRC